MPSSNTAQKLGIKAGGHLVLVAPPAGWMVPDLPGDVDVTVLAGSDNPGHYGRGTVVMAFFGARKDYGANIAVSRIAFFLKGPCGWRGRAEPVAT